MLYNVLSTNYYHLLILTKFQFSYNSMKALSNYLTVAHSYINDWWHDSLTLFHLNVLNIKLFIKLTSIDVFYGVRVVTFIFVAILWIGWNKYFLDFYITTKEPIKWSQHLIINRSSQLRTYIRIRISFIHSK